MPNWLASAWSDFWTEFIRVMWATRIVTIPVFVVATGLVAFSIYVDFLFRKK